MNVPDGWRAVSLGTVIRPETRREVPVRPLPYIGMENVEPGRGRITATTVAATIRSSSPLVNAGDVLYGRLRPYLNKVAIAPQEAYASGEFIVFRGNDLIDAGFLKWRLTAEDFVRFATGLNAGDRPRVKWPQMADFPLPLPPLPEQRRIVEMVEDHMARLDAADASLASAERRLLALRDSIIRSAVLGAALPGQRLPSTLDEVGTSDGELEPLPTGWRWSRLEKLADVVGGVTKDSKKQNDPSYVTVPYLRVANVQRGSLNLETVTAIRVAPQRASALELKAGDVLLNEGGDRDKLARGWVWEGQIPGCIHQNHVFRARVRGDLIDPYFLSHAANTIGGKWAERNGKQTTNLASISLSMIKKMPVPLPPPGEAEEIANEIGLRLEGLARQHDAILAASRRSAALRRVVLLAAFSGQLKHNHRSEG